MDDPARPVKAVQRCRPASPTSPRSTWRVSSVPEGGIHAFRNADPDTPASMLILFAPGAPRERYFDALAEIIASGRQLSDEEWAKFYADNDQYMV